MAYFCDDCKIVFPQRSTNCPFCGRRIYCDADVTQESLLRQGYTEAMTRAKRGFQKESPVTYDNISSSDSSAASDTTEDYFSALQNSYNKKHGSTIKRSDDPRSDTHRNYPDRDDYSANPRVSNNSGTTSGRQDNETDYFSQFNNANNDTTTAPTVDPYIDSAYNPTNNANGIDPYAEEQRILDRQLRRLNRRQRLAGLQDFFSNLRAGTVFRILFIIAIIVCVIVIWNLRYVILDSIVQFLTQLIPIVLVIGILVYIIKSFFKR